MQFDSFWFLPFLGLVFFVTYSLNRRYRWISLLVFSFLFYAFLRNPLLLFCLFGVTSVSYLCAIGIAGSSSEKRKKLIYSSGVILNLFALVAFRYLPFLSINLNRLLQFIRFDHSIHVPAGLLSIGVSFFVFQAISYLTDVYLGIEEPERNFGRFSLYMSFFPKLLQGPIERAGNLLPQLRKPIDFDYESARAGTLQFAWGLFKKVVIADRLAISVNAVYDNVTSFTEYAGVSFTLATFYYSIQIYCDFSGYTDMALGVGKLFGLKLTNNFNRPYFSRNIAEFWRRWHISFSSWIFDYIFKPLQMKWRNLRITGNLLALMITFLVSGLWHGTGWCFIIWGLLNGLYLCIHTFYSPLKNNLHSSARFKKSKTLRIWHIFLTFNVVTFAWIFFRSDSIKDALYITTHLFSGWVSYASLIASHTSSIGTGTDMASPILLDQTVAGFAMAWMCIFILFIVDHITTHDFSKIHTIFYRHSVIRWLIYICLVFSIFVTKAFTKNVGNFIYFQF